MAKYMIVCEHEPEDCEAMDRELQELGPAEVWKGSDFHCSCPYGYHAGWIAVEGNSEEQVKQALRPVFQSHSKVYQIESMRF